VVARALDGKISSNKYLAIIGKEEREPLTLNCEEHG
jgi:hypothetical protein